MRSRCLTSVRTQLFDRTGVRFSPYQGRTSSRTLRRTSSGDLKSQSSPEITGTVHNNAFNRSRNAAHLSPRHVDVVPLERSAGHPGHIVMNPPVMPQHPGPDWTSVLATRRDILEDSYTGDRGEYRRLRQDGATPVEAMDALLAVETEWEKPGVFGRCCPSRLGPIPLARLLRNHDIHPLSVAIHFLDHRQALRFLRRAGSTEFANWLGPDGCLILSDPSLRALPHGLVLRGNSKITHCPSLEDLGRGLKVLAGDLIIDRCPRLRWLPEGLETRPLTGVSISPDGSETRLGAFRGNLRLLDLPLLEGFGPHTKIRGTVTAEGCSRLSNNACLAVQFDPYGES